MRWQDFVFSALMRMPFLYTSKTGWTASLAGLRGSTPAPAQQPSGHREKQQDRRLQDHLLSFTKGCPALLSIIARDFRWVPATASRQQLSKKREKALSLRLLCFKFLIAFQHGYSKNWLMTSLFWVVTVGLADTRNPSLDFRQGG